MVSVISMKKEQRKYLADKFGDLANLAAAGLIFGQVVAGQLFSWVIAALGLLTVIGLYGLGFALVKKGGKGD